ISEISIPHFVAATIFSAQSGSKVYFYRNAWVLAFMSCTFGLFSGIRGGCFGVANQIVAQRMREKLFAMLLCQDIAFFDTEAVGVLTSRLGSDCQQVSRVIGNDFNIMFRNGLQGTGALIYLVMLSWQLALSTALLCCLMSTILFLYGRYQRSMAKYAQEVVASANEVAQETFSLARIVRTFGTEKQECERYSRWLKKLVDINLRQNVAYGLWTWSSNTLYHVTQVVALIIGGGFVMNGHITAEQLTKFVLYSEWVIHSTWRVGDHWDSFMQSVGASEKVFELMELNPSKQLISQGITKICRADRSMDRRANSVAGLSPSLRQQSETGLLLFLLAGTYASLTDSAFGGWDLIPVECSRLRKERNERGRRERTDPKGEKK
ncbi:hypothetical protein KI387_003319, partial [Taxus chinensis]